MEDDFKQAQSRTNVLIISETEHQKMKREGRGYKLTLLING